MKRCSDPSTQCAEAFWGQGEQKRTPEMTFVLNKSTCNHRCPINPFKYGSNAPKKHSYSSAGSTPRCCGLSTPDKEQLKHGAATKGRITWMQHSGFKGQHFTGNSWSCFCEALSSNSQPLPDSAWLRNNSPLEPQQCLCTSARGQRTSAPSFCSQAQLRHMSLTWEPSCCAGPSRLHTGPCGIPRGAGKLVTQPQRCKNA